MHSVHSRIEMHIKLKAVCLVHDCFYCHQWDYIFGLSGDATEMYRSVAQFTLACKVPSIYWDFMKLKCCIQIEFRYAADFCRIASF